ncbi:SPW repeat protein [Hyphomicrobium sp.]|uniref:SPW repeat protein n=1 Tax=Hyphomicrobium sp. TaxID=82 RepID=UPI002E31933B|nr:SPW repeat protein [Hyphomicrobium sp.]HEX2842892.1 SPW repeat protein [Hyphomicrobium sp.]
MANGTKLSAYWQDVLNCLLGIGLFFSPWALGFAGEHFAAMNAHVIGAIIAVLAIAAILAFQDWEEWISVVLGAWLIVSPWVMSFSTVRPAMLTHVLIGIATVVLAIWSSTEHGSHLPAR